LLQKVKKSHFKLGEKYSIVETGRLLVNGFLISELV